MNGDAFKREYAYQATLAVANAMLKKGIITRDEFCQIDTTLLKKYKPLLGSLRATKEPGNLDK